jgi:alpha,alpha-trehalose phosphorylase
MASLAGAWLALVAGFGGFRDHGGMPSFDPALPAGLTRMRFSIRWQNLRLTVDVHPDDVTYAIDANARSGLLLRHAGEEITVTAGAPITRPLRKRTPLLQRPMQPPGRAPISAHRATGSVQEE